MKLVLSEVGHRIVSLVNGLRAASGVLVARVEVPLQRERIHTVAF